MTNVLDFLSSLATDPHMLLAFERDPQALLTTSKLSAQERALLLSRSQPMIAAALNQDRIPLASFLVDPAPDPLPDPDATPPEPR